MKYIFILMINIYQAFFSPLIKQVFGTSGICRYSPSCSSYAKKAIQEHGAIRGVGIAFKRLMTCHPYYQAV